ncbi:hypothetical protein LINPERPRIM_LOCUS32638, partial [Linum perenne]
INNRKKTVIVDNIHCLRSKFPLSIRLSQISATEGNHSNS